ncbi:hypothetical protein Tco_0611427 [Tanacetum coccineum]
MGYLNPPTSPPPSVSPPPPTHENASMDTTLTLSPITLLDVQFDTPLPSPPIIGHPILLGIILRHMRDDDEDDGASHASTPSPTSYLNSLRPLNYQRYDIPTSSQQDDDLLFEQQTVLLN